MDTNHCWCGAKVNTTERNRLCEKVKKMKERSWIPYPSSMYVNGWKAALDDILQGLNEKEV